MRMQHTLAFNLAALTLACSSYAQAPADPAASAALPTEPAGISYRYWPRQFFQWIGTDLPYSMIELDVDDRGPRPLYDAILSDRASGKRVHYTNQQAEASLDQAAGAEAHLVAMQFDAPADPVNGSTYLLRFATETGVPVAWQFVQGTDISERGSGLTELDLPTPMLRYREQGALAGEGTALKVGNITSVIGPWPEMSQPPYFTAFHGAISQDVHMLSFVPRTLAWKIDPASAAVAAGAEWRLTDARGRTLAVHVDSLVNGLATLHEVDAARGTYVTIEARHTTAGWALERVRYAPAPSKKDEHTVTLSFAPAPEGAGTSKIEIVIGRKTHLAGGTATMGADGAESWVLTQPAWAHKPPVIAGSTQAR